MDFNNYNLIIDSTYCDPDTIADIVMEEARKYYDNPQYTTKYSFPKSLIFEALTEDDNERLRDLVKELKDTVCISDNAIKVKQQNGKYLVTDNIDFAKAALIAGVSYLAIDIIK